MWGVRDMWGCYRRRRCRCSSAVTSVTSACGCSQSCALRRRTSAAPQTAASCPWTGRCCTSRSSSQCPASPAARHTPTLRHGDTPRTRRHGDTQTRCDIAPAGPTTRQAGLPMSDRNTPTLRHGDTSTRGHPDTLRRRQQDRQPDRRAFQCQTETHRHSDTATRRHGDTQTRCDGASRTDNQTGGPSNVRQKHTATQTRHHGANRNDSQTGGPLCDRQTNRHSDTPTYRQRQPGQTDGRHGIT